MDRHSNLSIFAWAMGRGQSGAQQSIDVLDDALKYIFSLAALTPIAVIFSGKWLGRLFKLPGRRKEYFQFSIPHVIYIKAMNDEVMLGFSLYIVFMVSIAWTDGKNAPVMLKSKFGANLGQFDSICVLSALGSLLAALSLFLLTAGLSRLRRRTDVIAKERDELVRKVSEKSQGDR